MGPGRRGCHPSRSDKPGPAAPLLMEHHRPAGDFASQRPWTKPQLSAPAWHRPPRAWFLTSPGFRAASHTTRRGSRPDRQASRAEAREPTASTGQLRGCSPVPWTRSGWGHITAPGPGAQGGDTAWASPETMCHTRQPAQPRPGYTGHTCLCTRPLAAETGQDRASHQKLWSLGQ